jgi:peptidyl-prolyl cis-trans isomerase D
MLRFLRRGQRWLTAAIVLSIGAVFVFYMGWGAPSGGGLAGGAVIAVGPYSFGAREFEREREGRERALQEALGERFDPRRMRELVDSQTSQMLVQRALLALEGESLGLGVSKQEMQRSVAPYFRGDDGRIDRQGFDYFVEREYGTHKAFLDDQRMRELALKALRLLRSAADVSDGEARESLRRRLEQVRIAFVAIDASRPPEGFAPGEAEIAGLLASREADLRALFEERSGTYSVPEQVHARHVLVGVDRDADEAEVARAHEKAEALLARLRAGEDFAELARAESDDPGSKEKGGDLGTFPRGRMVAPFEEVAFALEPGALSEPVRSDFGFHLIRVEERLPAVSRSFEEVREELARELLSREAAIGRARARADALAARLAAGEDLEAAARADEIAIERSGFLRRRPDGYVPGLGAAPELLARAFALEPGKSAPQVFEVQGPQDQPKLALVKLLERTAPPPEEIEAQLAAEREALLERRRDTLVEAWIGARRDALAGSGDLLVDLAALPRYR